MEETAESIEVLRAALGRESAILTGFDAGITEVGANGGQRPADASSVTETARGCAYEDGFGAVLLLMVVMEVERRDNGSCLSLFGAAARARHAVANRASSTWRLGGRGGAGLAGSAWRAAAAAARGERGGVEASTQGGLGVGQWCWPQVG